MIALSSRLLVVEDNEFQREGLLIMLEEMGMTDVLTADDGGSGLELVISGEPPIDVCRAGRSPEERVCVSLNR